MRFLRGLLLLGVSLLLGCIGNVLAQETTAGLQGTVKDASGAVVAGATVEVTAKTLVGNKSVDTDSSGYYRFANLPPDTYTVSVTAKGFSTSKRDVALEVGRLPNVDFILEVGRSETVVEVSSAAPQIDVTTNVTTTNVTQDVIDFVPHGRSFQSVIQFAPAARNEPLMGNSSLGGYPGNGSGGSSPGSTANGGDHGFSVAGGSDSENSYLVEGQETANLIGGYSRTSVPFDFIQEVEIKNSGIQAEHGGALGGVVNVIMRKGTNNYHGSIFSYYENDAMDSRPSTFSRYDPNSSQITKPWGLTDPNFQEYVPKKDKTGDVFPGFTFGGPIWRDHIFGFVGFNPEFNTLERTVVYPVGGVVPAGGPVAFSQNTQTYYTTARVDAAVTSKLRLYGSWLYQLQRQSGENLPFPDSSNGEFNISSAVAPSSLLTALGYVAPNSTTNVGADYNLTSRLILTGRFGYYFENYHDFGFPQTGTLTNFTANGVGATRCLWRSLCRLITRNQVGSLTSPTAPISRPAMPARQNRWTWTWRGTRADGRARTTSSSAIAETKTDGAGPGTTRDWPRLDRCRPKWRAGFRAVRASGPRRRVPGAHFAVFKHGRVDQFLNERIEGDRQAVEDDAPADRGREQRAQLA